MSPSKSLETTTAVSDIVSPPPLGIMTINKLLKSTKVVAAVTIRKNLQGHYHRQLWGIGTL